MSKSIRVDEETHAAPSALKREDETYDDVLSRLLEERREAVVEGAGCGTGATLRRQHARRVNADFDVPALTDVVDIDLL
ncbi:antitoxin VapB family protein [Halolamina sediminis]|uniref:antitoxin VapB family protein n=1 Tax=Halolamina sediminis TaxID=1480675 RepID=UPI001F1818EC|nr:antitoxin VapB family protein [Halolamina sediminis]